MSPGLSSGVESSTMMRLHHIAKACALVALAALVSALSGCAYLRNRAADLADVFVAEASVGLGAHLHVQVTDFLGTGIGFSEQRGVWLHGRYIGTGTRTSLGIVVINMSGVAPEKKADLRPLFSGSRDYVEMAKEGVGIYDDSRGCWYCVLPVGLAWFGPSAYFEVSKLRWWRLLDVSVGASALIGFHVCLSPGEAADFLLGFPGIDLAGDDLSEAVGEPRVTPIAPNSLTEDRGGRNERH